MQKIIQIFLFVGIFLMEPIMVFAEGSEKLTEAPPNLPIKPKAPSKQKNPI